MLSVNDVSKYLGKRELFRGVSLHVHPGRQDRPYRSQRVRKIHSVPDIAWRIEPDSGSVAKTRGLRIGHLPQEMVPARDKSFWPALRTSTTMHRSAGRTGVHSTGAGPRKGPSSSDRPCNQSTPERSNGSSTWLDTTLKQELGKSLKAWGFEAASLAFRYRSSAVVG